MKDFDVIIIGAGPGGYVSAIKCRQVSSKLVGGIDYLMKKNGVSLFYDHAMIVDVNSVELKNQGIIIRCKDLIIATGAKATGIPDVEVDGKTILLPKDALSITEVPRKTAIIGAGSIGMEFAYIWNTYGSEVTVFEWFDRILPKEDPDLSNELEKAINKKGIKTKTGTKIIALKKGSDGVTLSVEKSGQGVTAHEFDTVLFAMGIKPNTEEFGIKKLGLKLEKGYISVNEKMETSIPHVYAIGDVTGKFPLAHVASNQGLIAVEAIAGLEPEPINYKQIPKCTYCNPEIASIGLTEEEAGAVRKDVKTGVFPFSANGKALSLDVDTGFVKMVSDGKTGEVLGVHMIGPNVTEMISGISVAMKMEVSVEEIASSIHPHPTLSEAIQEASHGIMGHYLSI